MGLCVFSLPISLVMIERIYTLSYYHHQIRRMNYHPLFRVRSWNNDMLCMSLYILWKGFHVYENHMFSFLEFLEWCFHHKTNFLGLMCAATIHRKCIYQKQCATTIYLGYIYQTHWIFPHRPDWLRHAMRSSVKHKKMQAHQTAYATWDVILLVFSHVEM